MTFFVVDAIAEGHRAARSIDCYLRAESGIQEAVRLPTVEVGAEDCRERVASGCSSPKARIQIPCMPLEDRSLNFKEVDLTFSETQARLEADRCLTCGPCSECMACVQACSADAIRHDQTGFSTRIDFDAVIYSDDLEGFRALALENVAGLYHLDPDDPIGGLSISAEAMAGLSEQGKLISQSIGRVTWEAPDRLGILVCECGGAISSVVDVEVVCDQAAAWPGVIASRRLSHACLPESTQVIQAFVDNYALNAVVLGACSCCALDQVCYSCTYQRVRARQNLGMFSQPREKLGRLAESTSFEFVNLREQCAWPHADNPDQATAKAAALLRAAAARARGITAGESIRKPLSRSVLVIGQGEAGTTCQQALSRMGIEVQLVRRVPDKIIRTGGWYAVSDHGETCKASSVVLTPVSYQEENSLLNALGGDGTGVVTLAAGAGLHALRPGVFSCSSETDPQTIGNAAAVQAAAWLGRVARRGLHNHAVVTASRCRACGTCIEVCGNGAPELVEVEAGRFVCIDPLVCSGCGTCIAHCPSGAISNRLATDVGLEHSLNTLWGDGNGKEDRPKVVVLTCNWNAYQSLERAGANREGYSPTIFPLRVACLGEISAGGVLQAFHYGADGVLLLGCQEDECHYGFGSRSAEDVFNEGKHLVRLLGRRDETFRLVRIAIEDDTNFVQIAENFASNLRKVTK
jgi:coenzyme F420-reducing hydrogenase delta subunit/ferredoxin